MAVGALKSRVWRILEKRERPITGSALKKKCKQQQQQKKDIYNYILQEIRYKKKHYFCYYYYYYYYYYCRSQWPRGLRRRSTAARLLRSWVRFPPGAWMSVCCVWSGRGLCNELITRSEESYRLWRVVVCDLETTKFLVNEEEAKAHYGAIAPREKLLLLLLLPLIIIIIIILLSQMLKLFTAFVKPEISLSSSKNRRNIPRKSFQ